MLKSYQESVDYLFAQLPMFHRIGAAAYKPDLGNIVALCERLGHPERKLKCVHIAGTNGKGSTTHLLAAAYQAQGLRVGVFTSPHYIDFRERIKINGEYIPEASVVEFTQLLQTMMPALQPSFFEATTAMAFWYFEKEQPDLCIIETGMGGRLDSTNVVTPLLSVITNISFDHTQFLGDTLPKIAGEKAGIIKHQVPVVIGETHSETQAVFLQKANECESSCTFADQLWLVSEEPAHDKTVAQRLRGTHYTVKPTEGDSFGLYVGLFGNYQLHNVTTAIESLRVLNALPETGLPIIPLDDSLSGAWGQLKSLTKMMGRWEMLSEQPLTLADSAHNEAGIRQLFQQVNALGLTGQLRIVYGMVNDKDVAKALALFPKEATYYFCRPNIPRGLEVEILQQNAAAINIHGQAHESVAKALKAAQADWQEGDLVLVAGSIFVVAEVL